LGIKLPDNAELADVGWAVEHGSELEIETRNMSTREEVNHFMLLAILR